MATLRPLSVAIEVQIATLLLHPDTLARAKSQIAGHDSGKRVALWGDNATVLTFYVLLWARPGMDQALIAYEDSVLALVRGHGGAVLHRARSDGTDNRPLEIQLYEWPSQAALDSYMRDPRRTAQAADRDRAIARTEIIHVEFV